MTATIHPIRPNMPVISLMSTDELRYEERMFLTAQRTELLKVGHQIIVEEAYMKQRIDNLAERATRTSGELRDCEDKLRRLDGDGYRQSAVVAQDCGECG